MKKRIAVILAVIAILAISSVAAAQGLGGRPFFTELTGAAEVPGPGDPDGSGTAFITLNHGQGRVCWALTYENIGPVIAAAHIHVGTADVAGPVVVPLSVEQDGDSSGCADVERSLIKAIIQNPENYYVNVHTSEFPPGAIRGQLGK